MGINIDFKMLPMKAHYLLYNAGKLNFADKQSDDQWHEIYFYVFFIQLSIGTGSVVPFMPVLARQLGFSTFIVGTVYSILPILGLVAKPLFGAIADKLVLSLVISKYQFIRRILFLSLPLDITNTKWCFYFSYF